jgi:predicted phosphodiesterase
LTCFFVSDLHGQQERYQKLYEAVRKEQPEAVFFGGDILPSTLQTLSTSDHTSDGFIEDILVKKLDTLKQDLKQNFPRIFLILGNDDSRADETKILGAEKSGLLEYIHNKKVSFNGYQVFGYAYTPPSPFLLKDWERYDVSRHVDPGAVSPEEGFRTVVIWPGRKISVGRFFFFTPHLIKQNSTGLPWTAKESIMSLLIRMSGASPFRDLSNPGSLCSLCMGISTNHQG